MAVADTITSMQTHVQEAYDAIASKGGSVPVSKNLENLDEAIKTLEDAGVTPGEYGALYYLTTANNKIVLRGVQLNTEADFNAICTNADQNSTITVNGTTITKSTIVGYTFGTAPITTIPSYFCAFFTSMTRLLHLPNTVTKIGSYFMSNCRSFNTAISLPDDLTEIGGYFMLSCKSASSAPSLANTHITQIPDGFMYYCSSLNTVITIPEGVTSVGDSFLAYCSTFNKVITFPSTLTTIGDSFLSNCSLYNQPIEIASPIASIGNNFLFKCSSFASSITINGNNGMIGYNFANGIRTISSTSAPKSIDLTGSWTSIGDSFLANSAYLSCPVNIAGNNLIIGNSFLAYQTNSVKKLTFTGTMSSIGSAFMQSCPGSIATPSFAPGLSVIGNNFMRNCPNFSISLVLSEVEEVGDFFLAYTGERGFGSYESSFPKLKKAGNYFMAYASGGGWAPNTPELETVGNYFLAYNRFSINSEKYSKLKSIGTYFMAFCTSFQSTTGFTVPTLDIPIPEGFLASCDALTKLVIPAGVTFEPSNNTLAVRGKNGNVIAYRTGVTLSGDATAIAAAKTALPNLTGENNYYRKLL